MGPVPTRMPTACNVYDKLWQLVIKYVQPKHSLDVFSQVMINYINKHIDGFVQDCSNSSALAMELLQYCT